MSPCTASFCSGPEPPHLPVIIRFGQEITTSKKRLMSEYQYYEFRAVDRPLTKEQVLELRRYSSRAEITATTFSVEYNWGDFKGDAHRWMDRYFDAFVHLANWGSRWFMLRIPSHLLKGEVVSEYCEDDYLTFDIKNKNLILSFRMDDEDGDCIDGEGWLSSLIALRADLINGDHRCLYLAWLRSIQGRDYEVDSDDDEIEPPLPAGLQTLSSQLERFADFLGIDLDLIAAAAEQSEDVSQLRVSRSEVTGWVRNLSPDERDSLLVRLVEDDIPHSEAALRQRVLCEMQAKLGVSGNSCRQRTVAQILARADAIMRDRQRIETEKAEQQRMRRERERVEQRRRHLESLRGRENDLWAKADHLIGTKQPRKYDEAVSIRRISVIWRKKTKRIPNLTNV